MTRFSAADIAALKERNPCDGYAMGLVRLRRVAGRDRYAGPCPFCSKDTQSKTDGRFECWPDGWVCAVCADGGDIISLVAKDKGFDAKTDFARICESLGARAESHAIETPQTAQRAGSRAFHEGAPRTPPQGAPLPSDWLAGWDAAADRSRMNERYRERERKRLYENFWLKAQTWQCTPVADYFALRGLMVPDNARIGYLPDCPYFADGSEREPLVVHRGPAMLCPIIAPHPDAPRGMRFSGLHFTWLDTALSDRNASSSAVRDALLKNKGKAQIVHPDTGEVLPSKKARGTKQGGYIDLGGSAPGDCDRVISGEGVENTLAGYTLLMRAGRDVARTHLRCGVDLGNLAGKAADRLTHPALKDAAGRARKVPGIIPDLTSPAMPLPDNAARVVWMCDGDSDPFVTQCAMKRCEARHRRADRRQVFMWPGDGMDWNDRI